MIYKYGPSLLEDTSRLCTRRDASQSTSGLNNHSHGIGLQVFTAGCHTQANGAWVPGRCTVDFRNIKLIVISLYAAYVIMSIQYLLFTQVSDRSTVQFTVCHCPHAAGRRSFFTSTFYVQPNLIDFTTIVDFTEFDLNNAAVYGTLICMLCLYVIVVAILRRKDQKDTEKVLIFMKVICCICKLSSLSLCSLHLDGFVIVGSTVPL